MCEQAQKRIMRFYNRHGNYSEVARLLSEPRRKVHTIEVWRAVNDGYISPKLMVALGFPPPTKPAPVCPDCGQVHEQYRQCDKKRTGRTRHRPALETETAEQAEQVRALFREHGGPMACGDALADGRLIIVEVE